MRRGIHRELGTAQREAAPLLTPELRRPADPRPRGRLALALSRRQ
jgi:hypothetical protein